MYRINLVVMVALSLAVIGSAVFLAMGPGEPRPTNELEAQALLYRLADSDPDISREAREEILDLGVRMKPALEEASSSDDEILAERAGELLAMLETPAKPPAAAEPRRAVRPEPVVREQGVRLELELPEPRILPGDAPGLYLRLINEGPVAVQVAFQEIDGFDVYARFGLFEVTDPDGVVHRIPAEPLPRDVELEEIPVRFRVVESGEVLNVLGTRAGEVLTLAAVLRDAGVYRVRYVYDAAASGAYRAALDASEARAMPLPEGLLASNVVALTVAAAR